MLKSSSQIERKMIGHSTSSEKYWYQCSKTSKLVKCRRWI